MEPVRLRHRSRIMINSKLILRWSVMIFALSILLMPSVQASDEPETELGKVMEKMSGAFRRVRKQMADPSKNADSLGQVAIMKTQAEAAKKLTPAFTEDQPADKRPQFIADYKKSMDDLAAEIGKLEAA